jgi:hypothetical protein
MSTFEFCLRMIMNLSKSRAEILAYVAQRLPVDDDLTILNFQLSPAADVQLFAAVGHVQDEFGSIDIVFSLPEGQGNVFFGTTSGDPKNVARILANLEDYEHETARHLHPGEVVRFPNASSDLEMPDAVLLLPISASTLLADIEGRATIDSRNMTFVLAMPVSHADLEYRRIQGHDALIDYFEEHQRELGLF